MASKRDLFQSYQFSVRRVVSGLVQRETDPAQSPLRRMGGAMFGSVMLAVLALAVTGVIGVIKGGGNKSWQDGGAVIVEEETGATYAWLQDPETQEYRLHPVLNFASAALLVGGAEPISVSHASLEEAPRGQRLGIAGAPDSIPPAESFDDGPWTLCSEPAQTDSGVVVPSTALLVGHPRSEGTAIGDGSIVLHDVQTEAIYLVWNGHRFLLPEPDSAVTALGLRDAPQIDVGTAMLTALPEGNPIAAVTTGYPGVPSSLVPGRSVGQVIVDSTTEQYYLIREGDLRNLSAVEAAVTLSSPEVAKAYGGGTPQAIEVDTATVVAAPRVDLPAPAYNDPPRDIPEPAPVAAQSSTVCASFTPGVAEIEIAVDATAEGEEYAVATPERTQEGAVLADRVLVTGGHAVLVRSVQSAIATEGALYLVTEEGRRFAVPNEEARGALGLADLQPVPMPAALVARIPEGPALDPISARTPS